VIAALLLAAATPAGLTLQEALNLPANSLIARVFGPTGGGYREVRRPYLGGLPGRIDFTLDFASAPHPTEYPALCEVDILSVYFWPQEGNTDPNQTMIEHSRLGFRMYRVIGDLESLAANRGQDNPPSEATCAAAGPVLSSDGRTGRRTHFFYVGRGGGNGISALETYLSARALSAAIAAAREGRLPAIDCNGEERICTNPGHLLSHLPLDRLNGFDLVACGMQSCVDASFSPDPDPYSNLVLHIRIETVARSFDTPRADVSARHIHFEAGRIVN
jgi:hypothetical protein